MSFLCLKAGNESVSCKKRLRSHKLAATPPSSIDYNFHTRSFQFHFRFYTFKAKPEIFHSRREYLFNHLTPFFLAIDCKQVFSGTSCYSFLVCLNSTLIKFAFFLSLLSIWKIKRKTLMVACVRGIFTHSRNEVCIQSYDERYLNVK